MKKAEFMDFINGTSKEKLVQYMVDNNDGDFSIFETTEFIRTCADEPATIASYVKASDLNLNCDYIRFNVCYDEAQEADSLEDLFTDDEVTDYFDDLADSLEDPEFDDILIEVEA